MSTEQLNIKIDKVEFLRCTKRVLGYSGDEADKETFISNYNATTGRAVLYSRSSAFD
ncbi:hypothetical protein GOM44_03135, partial [Wolbachia endosymbiont of Atemnus politus]|nr:hypothetical protein [Wolbachia endosymbiont of Atemnus politus]